jgi:excinuclease ABC subunit B
VSLVAILDADKEGFLRSERSLIQTAGRAARNVGGRVVLYADQVTDSMRRALDEMNRRRTKQLAYNVEHDITPRTIVKSVDEIMRATSVADSIQTGERDEVQSLLKAVESEGADALIGRLEGEMLAAARALEFERAASLRDRIDEIRSTLAAAAGMGVGTGTGRGGRTSRGPAAREPRRRSHRYKDQP